MRADSWVRSATAQCPCQKQHFNHHAAMGTPENTAKKSKKIKRPLAKNTAFCRGFSPAGILKMKVSGRKNACVRLYIVGIEVKGLELARDGWVCGNSTLLWFDYGCIGDRMPLEHECYYGLGMDALVIACTQHTNVITVCAWMHW